MRNPVTHRQKLVRGLALGGVVLGAAAVSGGAVGSTALVMSSRSIAGVRFGTPKSQAVRQLATLFGAPTKRFVSNGCGPSYTEVEWRHLYAEFRRGTFTGFRYLRGGWEDHAVTAGEGNRLLPSLATANGVSLASNLGQVRRSYTSLKSIGTDRWQSRDGLIFYVSYRVTQPAPPTSRLIEIKYGTCGDW